MKVCPQFQVSRLFSCEFKVIETEMFRPALNSVSRLLFADVLQTAVLFYTKGNVPDMNYSR